MSMKTAERYRVFVSLNEHISAPFVWLSGSHLQTRQLVKITNVDARRSVWCEALIVDDNFRRRYNKSPHTLELLENQKAIIASEWYRGLLGLKKNSEARLEISAARSWFFWFHQVQASFKHPDCNVRLAVDLAIVSVCLGFVGLILGIISMAK